MFSQMNTDSTSYSCVEEQAADRWLYHAGHSHRESEAQCNSQAGKPQIQILICTLMWLFALYSSTAGKWDRSSLLILHNTSVMLCNPCAASNRGAAGFHWLTLQVDAHMPVGNENWFLQIHCTRWFKYFSWIWWKWKGKWESGSAIEKDLHWRDRNSIT